MTFTTTRSPSPTSRAVLLTCHQCGPVGWFPTPHALTRGRRDHADTHTRKVPA